MTFRITFACGSSVQFRRHSHVTERVEAASNLLSLAPRDYLAPSKFLPPFASMRLNMPVPKGHCGFGSIDDMAVLVDVLMKRDLPGPPNFNSPTPPGIVIMSPGGLRGQGGMASVTNVMVGWFRRTQPERPVNVLDPRGRGHVLLSPAFFLVAAAKLIFLRASGRAKILHLQVSERGSFVRKGVLAALGRLMRMTVIMHHHGAELIPFFQSTTTPMRAWTRLIIKQADLNVVLGERWRLFLEQEVCADRSRVLILPNAVPDTLNAMRVASERATRRGGQTGPFAFLFLAELSPRKGIEQFLKALSLLHDERHSIRAILAGRGQSARYSEIASQGGFGEICEFVGWVGRADVQKLLGTVDALVLPSFEEGLPMAILESLSYWLPVITTPVGSIAEFLTNGVECLLTRPGDENDLASAMRRLIQEPDLRKSLSINGRARFESTFKVDALMQSLLSAQTDILKSAGDHQRR